ncbi:MAG: hypothetical protein H0T60_19335 [Acidobacteria bacterium]|nr:hypothetical protein [Acidobacteriota bacterium]
MKPFAAPSFKGIVLLFALSFIVTAAFSASLKAFFMDASWGEVLSKGLLIPCFTWSVQLLLSAAYLRGERRGVYWGQLGVVCLIGSVALLPAAIYNLTASKPLVIVSVLSVLASVALMAWSLHVRLRRRGFHVLWAASWVLLILVNMSLYLYSVR